MSNPFSLKVITDRKNFCNRSEEISDLNAYAENKTNLVLFSPRKYGKTSLVKIVQSQLSQKGWISIYADMFGLASVDNLAERIAKGVYQGLYSRKTAVQKIASAIKSFRPVMRPMENGVSISVESAGTNIFGADLLSKTLEDLGDFIRESGKKIQIVFDEFQDITELGDPNIEGILRSHIQQQEVSYFFVGSRRRILLEMFTDKRRPLFQSAINYPLQPLPDTELAEFIIRKFNSGGKKCSRKFASKIVQAVSGHPYYSQKLSLFIFNIAEEKVEEKNVEEGLQLLFENESYVFDAILQGLSPRQISLVKAIAREPSASIMSSNYIAKHGLKSVGGVQAALKKLFALDYIEKTKEGTYRIVDPVFEQWLIGQWR